MIISSAILIEHEGDEPFIIMGRRHHNCFETLHATGYRRPFKDTQGFMTDSWQFLDRRKAKQHAIECGQIKESPHGELYSEDLW